MGQRQLRGQTALITGSTDGIGRATALRFAEEGAEVIVTGRDVTRGVEVVDEITAAGGSARFIQVELGDSGSLRELATRAHDVGVLVNNAGLFVAASTPATDALSFERSVAVNVRAPFLLTAALAPHMVSRGSGSIVNVSSSAADEAAPMMPVYAATKAALNSLTRTWAAEFAAGGVRVNAVSVGPTHTRAAEAAGPEVRARFASTTMLGRLADMREIAEAILFLASSRSSYVTGSVLAVDGGTGAM
jgi:NAD(P)-dependent dehydrogenase (short-subunit alcohol dehydrogenase family)